MFRPKRIGSDDCRQGRGDAAAKANHDLADPVFADIIPCTQHQGMIDFGSRFLFIFYRDRFIRFWQ
jgi:hypothetical protein